MSEGMSGIAAEPWRKPAVAPAEGGTMNGALGCMAPLLAAMLAGKGAPMLRPAMSHITLFCL